MSRVLRLSALGLSLAVAGASSAPAAGGSDDIYRYYGLKEARGASASDGIYQDFSRTNENVGKMWVDPDAQLHKGVDFGSVRPHIDRSGDVPHLVVDFNRQGYGVSVSIIPFDQTPEKLPRRAEITFEMRSPDAACVGVRMMERDGEVWGYGVKSLEYTRLCVEPGADWKLFRVPIRKEHPNWFRFVHAGNHELGSDRLEAELMAGFGLELGLAGADYFSQGAATVHIRNIRVSPMR